jgi:hypothetical protein
MSNSAILRNISPVIPAGKDVEKAIAFYEPSNNLALQLSTKKAIQSH